MDGTDCVALFFYVFFSLVCIATAFAAAGLVESNNAHSQILSIVSGVTGFLAGGFGSGMSAKLEIQVRDLEKVKSDLQAEVRTLSTNVAETGKQLTLQYIISENLKEFQRKAEKASKEQFEEQLASQVVLVNKVGIYDFVALPTERKDDILFSKTSTRDGRSPSNRSA
jgi:hypothetical protein